MLPPSLNLPRLLRLDALIRQQGTGSSKVLAARLNVSRSTLHRDLRTLKRLGAQVAFCRKQRTYRYTAPGRLFFGWLPEGSVSMLAELTA